MTKYYYNGTKTVAVEFATGQKVPTDPTTVTFKFRTPAGVTTTYIYGTNVELVKDATGQYHVTLTLSQEGTWQWTFVGTGAVAQALEGVIVVEPSVFN